VDGVAELGAVCDNTAAAAAADDVLVDDAGWACV